ncbi:MAG: hypothetical protein RBU29_01480 [bacterium]|nr:hypothetical protein [bacterium]
MEITREVLKNILREIIQEDLPVGHTPLADKWIGGTMQLTPADPSMVAKDIPIELFFHKIVMVRDRLRVLEQQINTHKTLSDAEKVHLQQYITKIYGTLTTFNILFKDRSDHFVGERSSEK